MHTAVGSTNPVKVTATERALGDVADAVVPVNVDSGVPEQPRGVEQTISGAEKRALRAFEAGDYDLAVGIEGGVREVPGIDRLFVTMWAAVTNGDRLERGGGPRLPLPEAIAERVRGGAELGPVMDDVVGRTEVKRREGAAGVLTGGHTDRRGALREAIAVASGPFVTDYYD
jgi:inosine/xanthosine triphosphatase